MDMILAGQIAHNARRFPDKTAVAEAGGKRMTYAGLHRASDRFARHLRANKVAKGDCVALLSHSCLDWVVAYIGIVKTGAIAVPINVKLTTEEIVRALRSIDCPFMVAAPEFLSVGDLRGAVGGVFPLDPPVVAAEDDIPLDVVMSPEDIEVILFTGGTTGVSKGVPLSYRNIFWNNVQLIVDTRMHEGDNTILATPLYHAGALNCWLLPHLYLGATATILHPYSPGAFLRAIHEERVTNGWAPPSMTRDLYTHPERHAFDLSSFQRWYAAGGPLSRRDREEIHALIPGVRIFYQYGLTEAGVIVTSLKEYDYERAPDSIGRAFLNCEVKILRPDLSDADVGEIGEIAVKGPAVMRGYYRAPGEGVEVFHDGWLRTGDLGSIDEGGFVYLRDRLKDMIKTGGLNVYSQEVESVLLRHPAVRDVAVIGVPDDKWGEAVTAVVVAGDGADVTEEALIRFAKDNLATYKAPKEVIFLSLDQLPINYSGKILKRELRARLLALRSAN